MLRNTEDVINDFISFIEFVAAITMYDTDTKRMNELMSGYFINMDK